MQSHYRIEVWARNLNEWVELPGVYSSEEEAEECIKKSVHWRLSYDLSKGFKLKPIIDFIRGGKDEF